MRVAVSAAAVGGAGGPAAVDVGDPAVAEIDQMVDGLPEPVGVGGADDVDGRVPDAAGQDHHRQPSGEPGHVRRR